MYWRPGCVFCMNLRLSLLFTRLRYTKRNIWRDKDAAAFVRSVVDGNETVPVVTVAGHAVSDSPGFLPGPHALADPLHLLQVDSGHQHRVCTRIALVVIPELEDNPCVQRNSYPEWPSCYSQPLSRPAALVDTALRPGPGPWIPPSRRLRRPVPLRQKRSGVRQRRAPPHRLATRPPLPLRARPCHRYETPSQCCKQRTTTAVGPPETASTSSTVS
ncbi:glutaredoxin domain-containing protein [Streptomyces sp. NPDC002513]